MEHPHNHTVAAPRSALLYHEERPKIDDVGEEIAFDWVAHAIEALLQFAQGGACIADMGYEANRIHDAIRAFGMEPKP